MVIGSLELPVSDWLYGLVLIAPWKVEFGCARGFYVVVGDFSVGEGDRVSKKVGGGASGFGLGLRDCLLCCNGCLEVVDCDCLENKEWVRVDGRERLQGTGMPVVVGSGSQPGRGGDDEHL